MYRNKKIIAMIPARLGSQRVKLKNLRYLGDKLLSEWVVAACKEAGIFDSIYINSDSDVFQKIANENNVSFYKRSAILAANDATNDDFGLDFVENVDCDILVQVNPTSPFTRYEDIVGVVDLLLNNDHQTVHTIKEERIEGLFSGRPLNFDPTKQMPPSQELEPVYLFTSSIMAWDVVSFKANMNKFGCAVYGGSDSIGYYVIEGDGAVDIDYEKDFSLAETILESYKSQNMNGRYYDI